MKNWIVSIFNFECENEMIDLIDDLILCNYTAQSDDHFIAHQILWRHRWFFLRCDQLQQNLLSQIDFQKNETSIVTKQSQLFDNFWRRKFIWNNQRNEIAIFFAKSSKINRSNKIKIKIKITSFLHIFSSIVFRSVFIFNQREREIKC